VILQTKYREHLAIVGISEDEGGPTVVRPFARRVRINYPVVMSTEAIHRVFPTVTGLPTTFLIDRDGLLVRRFDGMLDSRNIEREVQRLIGASAPPAGSEGRRRVP
jgi:hypothetical protein